MFAIETLFPIKVVDLLTWFGSACADLDKGEKHSSGNQHLSMPIKWRECKWHLITKSGRLTGRV